MSGESSRHDGAPLHHRRPGCDAHRGVWTPIARLWLLPMNLSTSRYADYRPEWGIAIRTTVGRPRWFPHPYVHARHCTPYGVFGVYDDEAEHRAAYIARLDRHGDDVIAEINDITDGEGGTLLCYCRLDLARSFCHRLFLAQWIETRHGLYSLRR